MQLILKNTLYRVSFLDRPAGIRSRASRARVPGNARCDLRTLGRVHSLRIPAGIPARCGRAQPGQSELPPAIPLCPSNPIFGTYLKNPLFAEWIF